MNKKIHASRRAELLEILADSKFGKGIAIIPAAILKRRSNDVDYPFHQDPDFRYLTGYPEPDAIAVLRPGHEAPYTLFVLPRNEEAETWTGRRFGVEGSKELFGADEAFNLDEFAKTLPDILRGYDTLYFRNGQRNDLDQLLESTLANLRARSRDGIYGPSKIVDLGSVLHEKRLIKSPEEQTAVRHAVDVTMLGHKQAMSFIRPGIKEYDVEAVLEYVFRRNGAECVGYESVVATGANACILHYVENRATLKENDLILIDAGALVDGYSGDLTRTMPVSGKFSKPQKDLYEIVLAAHQAAVEAVKPDSRFDEFHKAAVRVLTEGMVSLGILSGGVDDLIESEAYKPYYMHRTGHWLGMDVHDVGRYFEKESTPRLLKPGMLLTVEPGIYLPEDDDSLPAHFRGIGIRLEDDILVTQTGNENLSRDLPLSVEDVEAAMGRKLEMPS